MNCSLTGAIPANWALPSQLVHLYLQQNKLQGSIPWATWQLPNTVEELKLGDNELVGPLPDVPLPASLKILDLGGDVINGR